MLQRPSYRASSCFVCLFPSAEEQITSKSSAVYRIGTLRSKTRQEMAIDHVHHRLVQTACSHVPRCFSACLSQGATKSRISSARMRPKQRLDWIVQCFTSPPT